MTQSLNTPYSKETAGAVMLKKDFVPVVPLGTTISHVRNLLTEKSSKYESINYIYVTDKKFRLYGIFSIREFFTHQKDKVLVDDIIEKNLITVRSHTHQERAVMLALQHNLKSLPIVDKEGVLIGVIPSDTLLRVLDKESAEDILRLRGIYYTGHYDDLLRLPVVESIKHRLPWLLVGLVGGLLAAGIVNSFEETLSQNLILAAFIPLVVYMADAVGTQMEAFIIRDFAVHPNFSFIKYFFKQALAVGLIGIIISILVFAVSFFLYGNILISSVLGIAIFFAMLSSVFSGLIIPYFFRKLQFDPANASGPIATIIQDVLSVSVYFLVAFSIL